MDIVSTVQNAVSNCGADVVSIGKSICGNEIWCAHCGDYGDKQIVITAAIHARECYTSYVVLRQLELLCDRKLRGGVYFIPLVNPDGAAFFENGNAQGSEFLKAHIDEHKRWKSNADGVDLNCNFDANWGSGALNVTTPGAHGYIGEYALCAPESRALAQFTQRVLPAATVSYHCMGGELYWEFFQTGKAKKRDNDFATAIARKIGVKKVDGDLQSAGGYKDYCVQKLKIPAVTIELISKGEHPFSARAFIRAARKNESLPEFILEKLLT